MAPSSMSAAKTAATTKLVQSATVYGADSNSGRYTVILQRSLACRLIPPTNTGGLGAFDRAELMAGRNFKWDPDFFLPESAQIDIDGIKWQPKPGTFQALGDGTTVVSRRCMVVRQGVVAF